MQVLIPLYRLLEQYQFNKPDLMTPLIHEPILEAVHSNYILDFASFSYFFVPFLSIHTLFDSKVYQWNTLISHRTQLIIPSTPFHAHINHFPSPCNPTKPLPIPFHSKYSLPSHSGFPILITLFPNDNPLHLAFISTNTSVKQHLLSLYGELLRVVLLFLSLLSRLDKHIENGHNRNNDEHNEHHDDCNYGSRQPRHSHIKFRRALSIGLHVV